MVRLNGQEVIIRQFITRTFLKSGFAPRIVEIQREFGLSWDETLLILHSLAEKKALVLHPHTSEVWLAHPFSHSPNAFWVETLDSQQGWWSNCTWCAMGVSSLIKRDVRLLSRWGGESEPFEIEVRNGRLSRSDFVVHMGLPVSELWKNVIHSCSLMLPHKSENDLNAWCVRHRISKGSALKAEKCLELSEKWYGTYLDEGWNRKSSEEVDQFFSSIGLDLNFRETSLS